MISGIARHDLERVAKYAYRLNSIPQHKCKAFPTDYDSIVAQFEKMSSHPNDELLVSTDDTNILGVLAILVEPEDMYLEAIGGVFADDNYEAIAKEFYAYLRNNYRGYRFDAAYPKENEQAVDFMKSIGAELLDYDYELRLSSIAYENVADNANIIELNEEYHKSFVETHNEAHWDAYWTGERLLKALDKFDIFIAVKQAKVIGSVVTSKLTRTMEEIYFLDVVEDKRNQGYGTALINKALQHAFDNGTDELMVMVGKDNMVALHLFEKLGFRKTDTCLTYSMKLR